MGDICKETICTHCQHLPICKYAGQVAEFQRHIDFMEVPITGSDDHHMGRIGAIPFLHARICCDYFVDRGGEV